MTSEMWKPVVSRGGVHCADWAVSDLGNVRALRVLSIRTGRGKAAPASLCSKGYAQVFLTVEGAKGVTVKTHRLVAEAFLGPRPDGMQVNHINGDRADARLVNLEYATGVDNAWHAHRHLRQPVVTIYGEAMCFPEAVARYGASGVTAKMARRRTSRFGWSVMEALTTPPLGTGVGRGQVSHA